MLQRTAFPNAILTLLWACLLSACGSEQAEQAFLEAVEINQLNIASIAMTMDSGNDILEAGTSETLTVMAQLDNGGQLDVTNKVTLSSSDTSVFTVNPSGRVKAKNTDSTANVWAHWADLSTSLSLEVSTAALTSITVIGPSDVSVCDNGLQYSAEGTYGVGDTRNISHLVSWSSSDAALAQIGDTGVADTYANGAVNIRASHNGINSMDSSDFTLNIRDNLSTVTLSPYTAQTLTTDDTLQFIANASYSDGSPNLDITSSADWNSTNTSIISIQERDQEAGFASAGSTGTADITASCDDNNLVTSPAVAVTVEARKTLTDVEIRYNGSAATVDLEVSDGPIQLEAFLVYSNGDTGEEVTESDDISWRVTAGSSAEVNNDSDKGEVRFVSTGRTTIEVIYDDDTYNFDDTIDIDLD
ncbi:MAG: hypothetical protein C9356_04675 [Oleiphilus sp.]|nr:MAG: hypothetical protein C9356_04675 [Oleiphilus sp.]